MENGATNKKLTKNPNLEIEDTNPATIAIKNNLPNTGHQNPFASSLLRQRACAPLFPSKTNAYSAKQNHSDMMIPGTINNKNPTKIIILFKKTTQ